MSLADLLNNQQPLRVTDSLVLRPFSITVKRIAIEDAFGALASVYDARSHNPNQIDLNFRTSIHPFGGAMPIGRFRDAMNREQIYHAVRDALRQLVLHEIDECLCDETGRQIRDPHSYDL